MGKKRKWKQQNARESVVNDPDSTEGSKSKELPNESVEESESASHDIPIPQLPKEFLWMHVNSGTKIRNVLNYALKEDHRQKSVVWSGAGQGIGKVITCAELFKKKNPGMHQITKLRYVNSKKAVTENDNNENRKVPEIHILLSKESLSPNELGYQSSTERGLFSGRSSELSKSIEGNSERQSMKTDRQVPSTSKLSNIATAEFAAMGLRTGQKRSYKDHRTASTPSKYKSRKKEENR